MLAVDWVNLRKFVYWDEGEDGIDAICKVIKIKGMLAQLFGQIQTTDCISIDA